MLFWKRCSNQTQATRLNPGVKHEILWLVLHSRLSWAAVIIFCWRWWMSRLREMMCWIQYSDKAELNRNVRVAISATVTMSLHWGGKKEGNTNVKILCIRRVGLGSWHVWKLKVCPGRQHLQGQPPQSTRMIHLDLHKTGRHGQGPG